MIVHYEDGCIYNHCMNLKNCSDKRKESSSMNTSIAFNDISSIFRLKYNTINEYSLVCEEIPGNFSGLAWILSFLT